MPQQPLGKTKNGIEVSVDMVSSHATTHFAHHPKLLEAVKKIIPTLEVVEEIMRVEIDTGEVVGATDLVETGEEDEIFYAIRPLRSTYSRFVKNKKPSPTTWVTLDLRKVNDREYCLYTAFAGRLTPSFPGGNYLPEQSKKFWSTHALVWGTQEIKPGTETEKCPW
jgi:hypothetical protein